MNFLNVSVARNLFLNKSNPKLVKENEVRSFNVSLDRNETEIVSPSPKYCQHTLVGTQLSTVNNIVYFLEYFAVREQNRLCQNKTCVRDLFRK